ncbi:hypothetical protein [Gordonia sp. N1V]|uniref:hypothetical protein n=1 Tax=Gordonia sp. N1V TaxID=3034163 RepID=UPI0023E136BB|nr:hypothetical protein [Gordonia sp. N1V]MDF3281687.1 hypothetical protein [Gordonia sp. N1V]
MTTSNSRVLAFPTAIPPESAISDPTLDEAEFQRGYDEASDYLATLPRAWAVNHATAALAAGEIPQITQSYERGYRAALYGYSRHPRR